MVVVQRELARLEITHDIVSSADHAIRNSEQHHKIIILPNTMLSNSPPHANHQNQAPAARPLPHAKQQPQELQKKRSQAVMVPVLVVGQLEQAAPSEESANTN